MMKKIILICILFTSCLKKPLREFYDNNTVKKEFFLIDDKLDGKYQEFYPNGNKKVIHKYELGILKDTSIYYSKKGELAFKRLWNNKEGIKQIEYYEENKVKKEGFINIKLQKIKKWKFYSKNGELDFVREYKIIDKKQHLNQVWKINSNKDTLYEGSKYFDILLLKDTIEIGNPFLGAAFVRSHLFKENISEIFVCLPNKNSRNFNEDFSNISKVKLDTFYNLQHDIKNQVNFKGHSKPYTAAFGKKFINLNGNMNIRGFIEEYYRDKENDSVYSTKMYFDIPVFIKNMNKSERL